MHVSKLDFDSNPNVGLYAFANDQFCLVGKGINKKATELLKKVLDVPIHSISICGTSLIGVFIAGNNDKILVPSIAFDDELKELDKLKIKYDIIDTKLTALGNNILCNGKGCIVNPEFKTKAIKQISDALGVPTIKGTIAGFEIVGACAALNDKGCVIHRDIISKEIDTVEKILGIECTNGTINMGSPYLKSGVISNSKGFIIGNISSGPEIQFVDEGLGFVKY